jgi:SNF family Na+-dependent transporter
VSYALGRLRAGVTGFFRFWYDFIVGDSVLLAVGGALVLLLGYLGVQAGIDKAAEVMLPLVAIGAVAVSLPRRR